MSYRPSQDHPATGFSLVQQVTLASPGQAEEGMQTETHQRHFP